MLASRLAPAYRTPTLQALAWEFGKIGDDAPRLLRAAIRLLEDAPLTTSPNSAQADAILASGRWIAAAVIVRSLPIASVRFLT